VQKRLRINLFSPENSKNAANAYLKFLIEFIERLCEIEPLKMRYKEAEFDAKVIEWWSAKKYHEKRNFLNSLC